MRTAAPLAIAVASLALGACSMLPRSQEEQFAATWPEEAVPSNATNGAIYQPGYDIALFENSVARRVGDIVTIRLEEATNAQKSSTTTTSKSSSVDIPNPTLFGAPITHNGRPLLSSSIGGDNSFDGAGDSAQSNRLSGDITVTVARRLPNGNLLVRGQKWIGINQGREYVRIQGVIRPIDIQPDNSIASTKVADAHIAYGGQGPLANANTMGWLQRFFNSKLYPF